MKIRDASEEPIDLATLEQLKHSRHYGWRWKGDEPDCGVCDIAECGLVVLKSNDCPEHAHKQLGAAKQTHWARECWA